MPRPPNPLTREEEYLLRRFVDYDAEQDLLVWKPREPEDFGTTDPERTAKGFNRGKAGKPIALNAVDTFAVTTWSKRYAFTANKVRAFLGAPHRRIDRFASNEVGPKTRTVRHPHARGSAAMNTNPDGNMFERDFIRKVMEMGRDKVLRWKRLDAREDKEFIEAAVRERMSGQEHEIGETVTWRSMRIYNARRAGTEVQVTTAGVVRMFKVIKISPYVLEEVFQGCRMGVTDPAPAPRKPEITPADLRAIIGFDPTKGPVWKARGKAEWFRLVLLGAADAVPDDKRIEDWNAMYVGERVPITAPNRRAAVYRIGKRTVGLQRFHAAIR